LTRLTRHDNNYNKANAPECRSAICFSVQLLTTSFQLVTWLKWVLLIGRCQTQYWILLVAFFCYSQLDVTEGRPARVSQWTVARLLRICQSYIYESPDSLKSSDSLNVLDSAQQSACTYKTDTSEENLLVSNLIRIINQW